MQRTFLLLALLLLATPSLGAQTVVRSVLGGRIVDRRTGQPIPRARIVVSGMHDTLIAGTDGQFETDRASMGAHVVEIAAIGYAVSRWILELGEARADITFELDSHLPLMDSISVTASRGEILDSSDWRSTVAFEHRRHRGGGQFLTLEQIRHSNTRSLGELLRIVPGLLVACSNRLCQVRMMSTGRQCLPDYVLDGAPASLATGPSFPVVGVRAIEVYRAADAPIELSHPGMQCGVIAIWTNMER